MSEQLTASAKKAAYMKSYTPPQVTLNCLHCLRQFSAPRYQHERKYCSFECGAQRPTSGRPRLFSEVRCQNCGTAFYPYTPQRMKRKYCSLACYYAKQFGATPAYKPRRKECVRCGHAFIAKTATIKYCSHKCAATAGVTARLGQMPKRTGRNCNHCGKLMSLPPCQLKRKRYCSRSCYRSYGRKPELERKCSCGQVFTVKPADSWRKYCTVNKCYAEHRPIAPSSTNAYLAEAATKRRETLSPSYVKSLLRQGIETLGVNTSGLLFPPDLVETETLRLRLVRAARIKLKQAA